VRCGAALCGFVGCTDKADWCDRLFAGFCYDRSVQLTCCKTCLAAEQPHRPRGKNRACCQWPTQLYAFEIKTHEIVARLETEYIIRIFLVFGIFSIFFIQMCVIVMHASRSYFIVIYAHWIFLDDDGDGGGGVIAYSNLPILQCRYVILHVLCLFIPYYIAVCVLKHVSYIFVA